MQTSNSASVSPRQKRDEVSPSDADLDARGIAQLTDRQRSYLLLVLDNHSSKEIAALTGASPRTVDKQLLKAMGILGVSTRFEAARLLKDPVEGVEPLPQVNALPSEPPVFPLPPVLPTADAAVNLLNWKQAAVWTAIISIVTPIGLTAAGMAILTLLLLLGYKLT
jgi:DNA-binding CsgD family transcriptional regulator